MRAWFINLGPPSLVSPKEANGDISAIWETEPGLLMGCEAIDKGPLPPAGKGNVKIRDTSRNGRDNIWAYIKGAKDNPNFGWDWIDCTKSFPRAEHPDLGPHPPRSILRFPFDGSQIVVAHKPPLWKGAGPARWEHDQRLARIMNPDRDKKRSRMLFWDSNGVSGSRALARKIEAHVVGETGGSKDTMIDHAVVRRIQVVEAGYRHGIGRHKFHTDHPWGAYFIRWEHI